MNILEALETARACSHGLTTGLPMSDDKIALGYLWRLLKTGRGNEALDKHQEWVETGKTADEILTQALRG